MEKPKLIPILKPSRTLRSTITRSTKCATPLAKNTHEPEPQRKRGRNNIDLATIDKRLDLRTTPSRSHSSSSKDIVEQRPSVRCDQHQKKRRKRNLEVERVELETTYAEKMRSARQKRLVTDSLQEAQGEDVAIEDIPEREEYPPSPLGQDTAEGVLKKAFTKYPHLRNRYNNRTV